MLLTGLAPVVSAQQRLFGSVDDPYELPRPAWWMRSNYVEGMGGLSLLGPQWRSAARTTARLETRRLVSEIDWTFRAGIYGRYEPDTDEAYDALRALSFARINTNSMYVRVGTPTRTRMGHGLVVDFFHAGAAQDERSVGLETAVEGRALRIQAMASDVRMDQVLSGRAEFSPAGSFRVGVGLTADRSLNLDSPTAPTAREVDVRFTAARSGGFSLEPFAGVAEYLRYGRGFSIGADLLTDNFIDLARVHARLAVQYGEDQFIPGYYGSFYTVSNPAARIIAGEGIGDTAGVPVSDASAGTYLQSEFRLLFFESFEFWYSFRRHFGSQALSTLHLRVFVRTRRALFSYSEDRAGLRGFFSIFNDVGDQSVMNFRTDYRLAGPIWLRVDARYGYIGLFQVEGQTRYAVQRRFEPFIGLRLDL